MKLEVLTERQRMTVLRNKTALCDNPNNDAPAGRETCEYCIISDLTDRLHAEQLRRESAEKVIQWAEEGMSPSFMRIEAGNYRKLHNITAWDKPNGIPTKDSKDTSNG